MDVDAAAPVEETAATYLARCLVAARGFVPGSFVEARPLAEACDLILTASDGLSVTIACIVDRDARPERRFMLDAAAVDAVARACRGHTGSLYGSRMPVVVEIWEIGRGGPDADDRRRLEALTFRRAAKGGATITSFAVDSATGAVFSTTIAAEQARRQAWVHQCLRGPRRRPEELRATRVATFAPRRPVMSFAVLAVLAMVFAVEVVLSPSTTGALTPPLDVLIGLGALDHHRIGAGEWWRTLTAAFLHGDLLHLAFNGIALLMAGSVLEKLVGRAWTLGLFLIGAVGGAAGSLLINDPTVRTVGASGAIMGMIAAALVLVLRLPRGPGRSAVMVSLAWILVPALLPLASAGQNVDYAAHGGGAIAGALAGAALLFTWPANAGDPRGRPIALAMIAAAAVALGIAVVELRGDWSRVLADRALVAELAPDPAIAALQREGVTTAEADAAIAAHPRDPRVRLLAALVAVRAGDLAVAQAHLEAGLAEGELLRLIENPELDARLREILAAVHLDQGDEAAAREAIAPLCGSPIPSHLPDGLRDQLCAP